MKRNIVRTCALLGVSLALIACDNPVSEEQHPDPAGVAVFDGGLEVARELDGESTGGISLEIGEPRTLTIRFLDEHGDPLELDEDVWLDVAFAGTSGLSWESDDGAFTGEFTATQNTAGAVTFTLMHGVYPDGHAEEGGEYTVAIGTPYVPIVSVNPPGT